MSRPQLLPHAILTPAWLAFNHRLPASVLQTWMQLRGLVQEGTDTPPLNIAELVLLIGKSQSCLYRHMTMLKALGALDWFHARRGMLIVSFAPEPDSAALSPGSDSQHDSQKGKNASHFGENASQKGEIASQNGKNDVQYRQISPPSSSIPKNLIVKIQEVKREGKIARPTPPEDATRGVEKPASLLARDQAGASRGAPPQINPPPSGNGKSKTTNPGQPVIDSYRRLTGRLPHYSVRKLLIAQVTDLALWESTLEHWLSHGWKPGNIAGQLQLYRRGGPSGCHYCPKENNPLDQTLENLDQLRKELTYG